jgi:hypothetical protein
MADNIGTARTAMLTQAIPPTKGSLEGFSENRSNAEDQTKLSRVV